MLQSVKQLFGDKLRASDGEIGRLKDFYFDDQKRLLPASCLSGGENRERE